MRLMPLGIYFHTKLCKIELVMLYVHNERVENLYNNLTRVTCILGMLSQEKSLNSFAESFCFADKYNKSN